MRSHESIAAIIATAAIVSLGPAPAIGQTVHEGFPVTDGAVTAMALSDDTLYVGGSFSLIGTPTGGGAPVDTSSGEVVGGFQRVHGVVRAVVADGAGGWFIGGMFDRVGSAERANLARIRPDGSVDAWNPGADGAVYALRRSGSTVYVAGDFGLVGGVSRQRLAAVDDATGQIGALSIAIDAPVRALAINDGIALLGGEFVSVGGLQRRHLAAVDCATSLLSPWDPDVDGDVYSIDVDQEILYAGGHFLHVSGVVRYNICAVSLADGKLTPWNGTSNGIVRSLAVSGGKVFVGGEFTHIGGKDRAGFAALSKRWWQALDMDLQLASGFPYGGSPTVQGIGVSRDRVSVGGDFHFVAGQIRYRCAAIDTTGRLLGWSPRVNAPPSAFSASDDRVYVGGDYTLIGGVVRPGLAAIDRRSESVLDWNPVGLGPLSSMPLGKGRRVASQYGNPTVISDDSTRYSFWSGAFPPARVSSYSATGALRWSSGFDDSRGRVYAIALTPAGLFVAGTFTEYTYAMQADNLMILDPATGTPRRGYGDWWWNLTMAVSGNDLY